MITFILTGANRGLGRRIHDLLNTAEYKMNYCIFISRSTVENKVTNSLKKYVNIDFSDKSFCMDEIKINQKTKAIVFINNAGIIEPINLVKDLEIESLENTLRVNFLGPLKLSQHLCITSDSLNVPLLIFNVSTGAVDNPLRGWGAYCISKASVKMAFNILKLENKHIKVVDFDPGIMNTEMQNIIRNTNEENMPDVRSFVSYKNKKSLKDPSVVASEILEIIRFEEYESSSSF